MAPVVIRPAATQLDWTLIKGDDFSLVLTVLDHSDATIDITGWTAKAQVRRSEVEPVLHEWTTEGVTPNATIDGAELTLQVVGTVTSEWGWSDAQLSVELTEPPVGADPGRVHTIARGIIRARSEITQ